MECLFCSCYCCRAEWGFLLFLLESATEEMSFWTPSPKKLLLVACRGHELFVPGTGGVSLCVPTRPGQPLWGEEGGGRWPSQPFELLSMVSQGMGTIPRHPNTTFLLGSRAAFDIRSALASWRPKGGIPGLPHLCHCVSCSSTGTEVEWEVHCQGCQSVPIAITFAEMQQHQLNERHTLSIPTSTPSFWGGRN